MTGALLSLTLGLTLALPGVEVPLESTASHAAIDRAERDGRPSAGRQHITATFRSDSSQAPSVAGKPGPVLLRVLSYNIHHGEGTDGKIDLPRLAGVIKAARPDLVALQEVDHKAERSGKVDQTAEFARLTGLHGKFGRQIDFEGGQYGQAVLSRFPIGDMTIHVLPGVPERQQRIAVEVRVRVAEGGGDLSFATTHLHHLSAEFRAQQAARINEVLGSGDRPAILAGDLNAAPDSPPIRILGRAWSLDASDPARPTYPAEGPDRRIDYILFRPASRFRLVDQSVLAEGVASDHRAILAVLELQPE